MSREQHRPSAVARHQLRLTFNFASPVAECDVLQLRPSLFSPRTFRSVPVVSSTQDEQSAPAFWQYLRQAFERRGSAGRRSVSSSLGHEGGDARLRPGVGLLRNHPICHCAV
eukprot:scpid18191/ scgid9987/ 